MANHKSALKRAKQNKNRAERNESRISRIKTFIKKFISRLGFGDEAAATSSFSEIQSEINRGVSRGVLHKNTASRRVSRLHRKLKASVSK
ncbi:MAG: 30S ribosomal protein S20 [Holosporaceae bacterium]|jgi:small subunit ribosomal protein S20|nr:30S ribosomal protein S20 [Holosporaceae bacterium]